MSLTTKITPAAFAPPAAIPRWSRIAFIVGVLFSIGAAIGAFMNWTQFLRSWLLAFMFWLAPTLGSLVLLMLQYVSGGNWGRFGRRPWEAASGWPMALMFICWLPIVVGMKTNILYPWTAMDPKILGEAKAAYYLNPTLFIIRGLIYFAIWGALAWRLRRWSHEEEAGKTTPAAAVSIENLSGAGIVLYGLTITFASVDWVMSLNPTWWSTVWGMLFMVGQALTAFALTILLLVQLSSDKPLEGIFRKDHLHDFGKLTFAFVILWAYLSFSQWLIIWSGNMVDEIRWYLDRLRGGWQTIGVALICFHFVLPFALMLSRNLKRNRRKLAAVALWLVFMRLLDLFWLIEPNFHNAKGEVEFHISPLDIVNFLAVGGLWLGIFFWQLNKRAILPVNDPQFVEMLEAKHG
ncbi:MAG TPA: hypothetical protein VKZ53_06610 [Candidatus Angelobacter sp.]|nr:hypothetical protein [Candidatus Angelobacter sp.]